MRTSEIEMRERIAELEAEFEEVSKGSFFLTGLMLDRRAEVKRLRTALVDLHHHADLSRAYVHNDELADSMDRAQVALAALDADAP